MTALEEIKKALEGVTPGPWFEGDKWVFVSPRSGLMDEALENVLRNDEAQANARYIAAVNPAAISELLSTLESLQRENEELRKDKDHIGAEKAGIAKNALNNVDYWKSQAEAAEAEVKHLQAEIDRKSSMSGDHRYWEGRYRDEAAENEKLRELLTPFAKFDLSELKQRAFLQILVCPEGDDHADNYGPHFHRARQALASTGGEHNAE